MNAEVLAVRTLSSMANPDRIAELDVFMHSVSSSNSDAWKGVAEQLRKTMLGMPGKDKEAYAEYIEKAVSLLAGIGRLMDEKFGNRNLMWDSVAVVDRSLPFQNTFVHFVQVRRNGRVELVCGLEILNANTNIQDAANFTEALKWLESRWKEAKFLRVENGTASMWDCYTNNLNPELGIGIHIVVEQPKLYASDRFKVMIEKTASLFKSIEDAANEMPEIKASRQAFRELVKEVGVPDRTFEKLENLGFKAGLCKLYVVRYELCRKSNWEKIKKLVKSVAEKHGASFAVLTEMGESVHIAVQIHGPLLGDVVAASKKLRTLVLAVDQPTIALANKSSLGSPRIVPDIFLLNPLGVFELKEIVDQLCNARGQKRSRSITDLVKETALQYSYHKLASKVSKAMNEREKAVTKEELLKHIFSKDSLVEEIYKAIGLPVDDWESLSRGFEKLTAATKLAKIGKGLFSSSLFSAKPRRKV